jgi:YD repeat-containing protein
MHYERHPELCPAKRAAPNSIAWRDTSLPESSGHGRLLSGSASQKAFPCRLRYDYDTENDLISITDANLHTTWFEYDEFGRVKQTNFPSSQSDYYYYDADNKIGGWPHLCERETVLRGALSPALSGAGLLTFEPFLWDETGRQFSKSPGLQFENRFELLVDY